MASRFTALRVASAPVLALAFSTTSCAAMFDGTKSTVMFQTTPPGAELEVDGKTYRTPIAVELSKKKHTCTLRHAEYGNAPVTVDWKRKTQGGFVLMDILFTPGFGLSGLLIDGMSGAFYKHPPMVAYDFTTRVASPETCKVDAPALALVPTQPAGGAVEASAPQL